MSQINSDQWGRRRLATILAAAAATGLLLTVGLAYVLYLTFRGDASGQEARSSSAQVSPTQGSVRNRIAGEPMLTVKPDDAFPSDDQAQSGTIVIPESDGTIGPGFVATGFPRTPEGAIGQLAQMDVAVLQSMSTHTAREVHQGWALPGGVSAEDWWITRSVEAFLAAASMGEVKDAGAAVTATPMAAQIKGIDGPNWVLACVLLKLQGSYHQTEEVAFGHCERMQWVGGRWMIAPGTPPAVAPSTWPRTAKAVEAGWHQWSTAKGMHKEVHS